jgi:hypothetical protein
VAALYANYVSKTSLSAPHFFYYAPRQSGFRGRAIVRTGRSRRASHGHAFKSRVSNHPNLLVLAFGFELVRPAAQLRMGGQDLHDSFGLPTIRESSQVEFIELSPIPNEAPPLKRADQHHVALWHFASRSGSCGRVSMCWVVTPRSLGRKRVAAALL